MGSGTYSEAAYVTSVNSKLADHGTPFVHTANIMSGLVAPVAHQILSPIALKVRESRDSVEHPESNPVIICLDVTGSMTKVVKVIHKNLSILMDLLASKGYLKDPQILFTAIGDYTTDSVPVQVSQFESDVRIEDALSNTFLEGGGGYSFEESYEMAAYVAARKTVTDSWEKRDKKGYMFIIGDEHPYPMVSRAAVKAIFGDDIQADIPTSVMFKEAKKKWNIFFILPDDANHGKDTSVISKWSELLGKENVILLTRADATSEVIAVKIGICEGTTTLEKATTDLSGGKVAPNIISSIAATFARKVDF